MDPRLRNRFSINNNNNMDSFCSIRNGVSRLLFLHLSGTSGLEVQKCKQVCRHDGIEHSISPNFPFGCDWFELARLAFRLDLCWLEMS
jgi:hypothetical protein